MKITHIITGLSTGGAEIMLYKLLSVMDREAYASDVISLTSIGPIGKKIESLGINVHALGMRKGIPNLLAVLRLAIRLRRTNPDVIQTWMYHADLIGGVAAKLAGDISVVWGIHNYDARLSKHRTIWIMRLCALLSKCLPKQIICCSEHAKNAHESRGYDVTKMVVIPNGIDLSEFKPDLTARASIRKELGISDDALIIGFVARFDSKKDHRSFIEAAGMFSRNRPNVQFILCGDGIDWNNRKLKQWISDARAHRSFHLLGQRQDIDRVMTALDIATLSSYGESFSLTIGEAMACGIPCVTTNIEAPVSLLGGCGWVVPVHDSHALCQAWRDILETSQEAMTIRLDAARDRIQKYFSLEEMAEGYQHLFKKVYRGY